jgi:hypothetical protein
MSRTALTNAAVVASLLLTALFAGCGSDNREANENPANVARVADEGTCRVCHALTIDTPSQRPIGADFFTATGSHNQAGRVNGPNADLGCQGCHGGGAEHNGVGPIPFPDPLNVKNADGTTTTRCITCHTAGGLDPTTKDLTALFNLARTDFVGQCARCHTSPDNGLPSNPVPGPGFNVGVRGVHGANLTDQNCVTCHSVVQNGPQHGAAQVNDNTGVRAVTAEFAKWSHHVTGVLPNAAHCAACHLEGTVEDGAIVVDKTKHMADAQVHLRNAADDSDFVWDPAAPNHTNMDNFCMSCHSATGATSPISKQIQAVIMAQGLNAGVNTPSPKTASPLNPFGDTISNRYDKMQRPGVTNVNSQFNTTNNSHHGVKGKRYSGRTRFAGARQIAAPAAFAQNSSALLQGIRSTIFDAGNFNALYVPLGTDGTDATGLGDDSTLHCGDCHTVGQWKAGATTNALGVLNTVPIGAHGSNNEYLLRNSIGSDERHTQNAYTSDASNVITFTNPNGAFLVCYNCHAYKSYGSIYVGTGADAGNPGGSELFNAQSHAGEYDQQARCNGVGETLPFGGFTTGKATDGTQFSAGTSNGANNRIYGKVGINSPGAPYLGEQSPAFGNIFGIQCLNCHNSGIGNAYGGIHGSANNTTASALAAIDPSVTGGAYIDGTGHTTKVERFLPGLGNAMYSPGSQAGYTGNVTNDTNWEVKYGAQQLGTVINFTTGAITNASVTATGAGCYTLDKSPTSTTAVTLKLDKGPSVTGIGGPATQIIGTWGGCNDHNGAQGAGTAFLKRVVRPVTY